MATRSVTLSIDEELLARVLARCNETDLAGFVEEAVRLRCESEDRSLALDAFTADFGQPWTLDLDWPEGPGFRLQRA